MRLSRPITGQTIANNFAFVGKLWSFVFKSKCVPAVDQKLPAYHWSKCFECWSLKHSSISNLIIKVMKMTCFQGDCYRCDKGSWNQVQGVSSVQNDECPRRWDRYIAIRGFADSRLIECVRDFYQSAHKGKTYSFLFICYILPMLLDKLDVHPLHSALMCV